MIYEYAMSPRFLIELAGQTRIARALRREIGIGKACILAGYPESLGNIAYAILASEESTETVPKKMARIQEKKNKVVQLATDFVAGGKAQTKRYGTIKWEGGFAGEHSRAPFEGIFSVDDISSPAGLPLRNMDWLDLEDCPFFSHPRSLDVKRTAQDYCDALTPLLQSASSLTFVDPYFSPDDRYKRPYSLFFQKISSVNNVRAQNERREILIVCARERVDYSFFYEDCLSKLPSVIPEGITIRIHRIAHTEGGQDIHNRYILSDIGGVIFGHGTDSSRNPRTETCDDILILDQSPFVRWAKAYTPGSLSFDWTEPPIILSKHGEVVSDK